jgi:AcrR family transcriptional regulator
MGKGEGVANERVEPVEAAESCARRRGRPLDAGREEAILKATIQLLGERGFDRFTVQDIADRAGVGLGTIYRRWPTKLEAVMAAVRLLDHGPTTASSGDVEADLVRALSATVRNLSGCLGAVIPGLVSAMRDDPDLARLLRETAVLPRIEMYREILAPAFPDLVEREQRAEMAVAIPMYRLLFGGKLPSEREIRATLVPLILGRPPAPRGRLAKPRRAEAVSR